MKRFSVKYKIIAVALTLAFTFQTMASINSNAYTTGVETIHLHLERMTCFGFKRIEPHVNFYCPY